MPAHDAGRCLAHLKDAVQIDGKNLVPFRLRKFVDRHAVLERIDARVIDENVEPAEFSGNLLDHRVNLFGIGDIHFESRLTDLQR